MGRSINHTVGNWQIRQNMAQRLFFRNSSKKPSKITMVAALALTFLFIFFTFKVIFNKRRAHYTQQTLSLPEVKTASEQRKLQTDWKTITAKNRDTLGSIFYRAGLSSQTLQAVLHDNPFAKKLTAIKPEQKIEFRIHKKILEKLVTTLSPTEELVVTREDDHYVTEIKTRKMDTQTLYVSATVRGSLYATAKRMNIPYKIMQQMTEIFTWEIDFGKDIHSGDQFTIMYEGHYINDKLISTGNILAVSYTNNAQKHQAIRYDSKQHSGEYFNAEGKSLKKAFTRYPLRFSHISSTFTTSRYHPILHYKRAHKGVDLAAPLGTPILATGDGHVAVIERNYGYGNMIKINHHRGFATVYGHLLKFQKGLARGQRVKRGQVIGYVGQTGLATGPHLHYEFHVNNVPKNPTTVNIPLAEPLSKKELAQFKAHANKLIAQLKLFEDAQLVSSTQVDPDNA